MKDPLAILARRFMISVLLFSPLYYIMGGVSGYSLLPLFALTFVFVCAVHSLASRSKMIHERSRLREEFARSLYTILYHRSKGIPAVHALERAAKETELKGLRSLLLLRSRRLRLGDGPEGEVETGHELGFDGVSFSAEREPDSIKRALDAYELESNEKTARIEATAQRYATVSMFLSTILPSFIIFGFIGSTVITESLPSMTAFAVVMLIAIPFAYSAVETLLSRRLFE